MKNSSHFNWSTVLFTGLLFMGVMISSCAPTTALPENTEQLTQAPEPTEIPTELPEYEDWEETAVKAGNFGRDNFCPVSFSYQSRDLGTLTVAIANNIPENSVDEIT